MFNELSLGAVVFSIVKLSVMMLLKHDVNSSPPGKNACHIADTIFRCIFVNETFCSLIKISPMFVTEGPTDNNPALV